MHAPSHCSVEADTRAHYAQQTPDIADSELARVDELWRSSRDNAIDYIAATDKGGPDIYGRSSTVMNILYADVLPLLITDQESGGTRCEVIINEFFDRLEAIHKERRLDALAVST